jgi:hypothetical protein
MEVTSQQFIAAFKTQPESVRSYIFSDEGTEDITTLAKKHQLSLKQTGDLASESGRFLVKITPAQNLAQSIQFRLATTPAVAETLATYIRDVIAPKAMAFVPPQESEDEEETTTESAPAPSVAQNQQPIVSAPQSTQAIHEPFYKPQPHQFVPPASSTPSSSQQVGEHHEPLPDMPVEEREAAIKKLFKNTMFDHQLEEQLEGHMGNSQPVQTQKQSVAPQNTAPKPDIMEARLKGTFSMPKEEVKIQAKQVPGTPSQPSQPAPAQNQAPKYPAKDPYREPLE